MLVWAPAGAARRRVDASAWPYVAASAALELVYVLLLGAATSWLQALGVYAVAVGVLLVRGRRPDRAGTAFGLAIAAAVLRERVSPRRAVGAAVVVAGVALLSV